MLVEHKSAVTDFFDKPRLEPVYFPEVERLIKQVAGAVHRAHFVRRSGLAARGAAAPEHRSARSRFLPTEPVSSPALDCVSV